MESNSSRDTHQDSTQLWVGDVKSWMDEQYLAGIFGKYGEIKSVKIIRDKQTRIPVGYGFVEFASHEVAANVLQTLTGTINPGSRKMFKLNWGVYGGGKTEEGGDEERQDKKPKENNGKPISVYVGDLSPDVTKPILLEHFSKKHPSAFAANIIYDSNTRLPKGYGFVQFADRAEADAAIKDLDGTFLRGRAIKVRESYTRTVNLRQNHFSRGPPKGNYIPGGKGMSRGGQMDHHAGRRHPHAQSLAPNHMGFNNYLGMQFPGGVQAQAQAQAQAMQQAQITNQLTAYALQQHQLLLQQQAQGATAGATQLAPQTAILQPFVQPTYPVYNGVMVQPLISGVGLVGMPTVANNGSQGQMTVSAPKVQAINYSKPALEGEEKSLLGPRSRPEGGSQQDLGYFDSTSKKLKTKPIEDNIISNHQNGTRQGEHEIIIGPKFEGNVNFENDVGIEGEN